VPFVVGLGEPRVGDLLYYVANPGESRACSPLVDKLYNTSDT